MSQQTGPLFTFVSAGLAADTFQVVRFTGLEALSTLYCFEILLICGRRDIDLDAVIEQPATFTIKAAGQPALPYHGILSNLEQWHEADRHYFYRAELRPRLWWLTLTRHNQVFLNQAPAQFLSQILRDGGLAPGLDFEFRRTNAYPVCDYVCQYGESAFDFLSRWMEWGGAYYWFEQSEQAEKMIVTDTRMAHTTMPGANGLRYSPISGLDAVAGQVVQALRMHVRPVPRQVRLKDYNYMKPHLDLQGQAVVQARGRGEVYLYAEHFLEQAQANRLATVRAEELRCRQRLFQGESQVPTLRPGYTFSLTGHFRDDFNQDYLTTWVSHEGSQARYLQSGLGLPGDDRNSLFYRNTFQCIPATTQFRPQRLTAWPRIHGTIPARIDAAGLGDYPELDQYGRYKVILPFDLSGRGDGKASAWLRMATPYAGSNHGMHFPLTKDTEVALSFCDGDPDRPFILAAMVNPSTPSVVNEQSQTQCRITTNGRNTLHFSDEPGRQYIHLTTPSGQAALKIGYHGGSGASPATPTTNAASGASGATYEPHTTMYQANFVVTQTGHGAGHYAQVPTGTTALGRGCQPDATAAVMNRPSRSPLAVNNASEGEGEDDSNIDISWKADGKYSLECGAKAETIMGDEFTSILGGSEEVILGFDNATVMGLKTDLVAGGLVEYNFPSKWEWSPLKHEISEVETKLKTQVTAVAADVTKLTGRVTTAETEVAKITGIETRVTTAEQAITDNKDAITATVTKIQTEVNDLTVSISQTYATKTQLAATEDRVSADLTEVRGAVSQVSGDVTKLRADVSQIDAACSRVATEVAEVATNVSVISAVIEMM
ncbi:type VI secretion system tip protein TssI/VgrG [uncultured Thiodictyon sp.]|uniref:type VI secretion system tip protein TssI/VgrG n=1 Tax=uncultured Thiodictyon sp. TaxID=1846217 RepID=UPI0025FB1BE2|nr:type VI secretion system tip protein TssI/VgrG [uncultured Thiodictyon sp.]